MKQRTTKDHRADFGWAKTSIRKGPDQKNVCAERHEATGYLCTREPGHGPAKAPLHVAHAGDDAPNGSPQSLVEWVEE